MDAVEGTHLVLFDLAIRQDVHYQLLAESGLILQMKVDSHIIISFLLDEL